MFPTSTNWFHNYKSSGRKPRSKFVSLHLAVPEYECYEDKHCKVARKRLGRNLCSLQTEVQFIFRESTAYVLQIIPKTNKSNKVFSNFCKIMKTFIFMSNFIGLFSIAPRTIIFMVILAQKHCLQQFNCFFIG